MEELALEMGLQTGRDANGRLRVSKGKRGYSFYVGWWSKSHYFANGLTNNKPATKALLAAASINVPRGDFFSAEEAEVARKYSKFLGFPLVIKPANGVKGNLVFSHVNSDMAFDDRWKGSGCLATRPGQRNWRWKV